MKAAAYKITFLLFLLFCSCSNGDKKKAHKKSVNIDTANSFKLDAQWVTPKKFFKFNSLKKSTGDTVEFVTCSEYVYSPFGIIKSKSVFKSSLLENFGMNSRIDSTGVAPEEYQALKLKSSKLIFFFDNDPEAEKHSNIIKGEIYDTDVKFDKDIKIGMPIVKFYQIFFKFFPEELKNKYKVIVLSSCIMGIKHIYSFKNGSLYSVIFQTDSTLKAIY